MAYASDKLIIDTPEQIPLEFQLAGVGSRALAAIVDSLILMVAYVVLFILFFVLLIGTATSGRAAPDEGVWIVAIVIVLSFLLQWGYFAGFEALWKGQTPGKRYLDIRVISDSGAPVSPAQAIGRNLLRIVDGFPMYGIGIVTVLINKQQKRLGDMVAGTVVVHERPPEDAQPALPLSTLAADAQTSAGLNASRLSVQELELIETFLQRRFDLEPEVRARTAFQISERVGGSLAVPRSERPNPETFLELVARQRRGGF
jgi:uncharacterized RDD family membrane protein YckC